MKLSERLLQQQSLKLDIAPLIAAFRKLRRVPSRYVPELLAMLAKRPAIAVMEQEHTADGVLLTAKPARELAMFLKRVERARGKK